MVILRNKTFAAFPGPGQQGPQSLQPPGLGQQKPGNLMIEQMRTEREVMKNTRKMQEIEAKEKQAKIRNAVRQQVEDRKDRMESLKERAKALKEEQNSAPSNTYLYKSKSVPTPPVPMK